MLIKKLEGRMSSVVSLPGGGWLGYYRAYEQGSPVGCIYKISPSGEVSKTENIMVRDTRDSFTGSIVLVASSIGNAERVMGIDGNGNLTENYDRERNLECRINLDCSVKIFFAEEDEFMDSILGLKPGETGVGIYNRATKNSKVLTLDKGTFTRIYKKSQDINESVSCDGATVLIWQVGADKNFAIIDIDI